MTSEFRLTPFRFNDPGSSHELGRFPAAHRNELDRISVAVPSVANISVEHARLGSTRRAAGKRNWRKAKETASVHP